MNIYHRFDFSKMNYIVIFKKTSDYHEKNLPVCKFHSDI